MKKPAASKKIRQQIAKILKTQEETRNILLQIPKPAPESHEWRPEDGTIPGPVPKIPFPDDEIHTIEPMPFAPEDNPFCGKQILAINGEVVQPVMKLQNLIDDLHSRIQAMENAAKTYENATFWQRLKFLLTGNIE